MRKKVVVIGGGLAGSLLCNELVERSEVILLERGGKDSIEFPRIEFTRKKFAEVNTCCYGGGGTTNLWHNGLIPIRDGDLTDESFQDVLSEAGRYIDKAASSLYFHQKSLSDECTRLRSEFNARANEIGLFADGIDCLIYPKKYRKLCVRSEVQAVYDVDRLDFFAQQGKVTTVSYSVGSGRHSVEADVVVVCAGTLGTPKVLERIITAAGASFNGLGTGFIDHPMGFVGKVRFGKEISGFIRDLSSYDGGDYVSRNAVRLKSDCGKYTCCAFFRPALTMDNRLAIYKYKSSLGASNGIARFKSMFSPKLFHPDIVAEIISHLFGVHLSGRTYNILFIAEQKRGSNRVFYDGDDLKVDWCISDEEIAIYRRALEKLGEMLAGVATEFNLNTEITEEWLWSAAHHSGTTPLGATGNDLIDQDLKLKCCENVYVCDGSVIQEHSYANTGLAIGQLALRLADRIGGPPPGTETVGVRR